METNELVLLWIVDILFIAMSIVLLSGKGAFLVKGYNTLPKDEKEYYNGKQLSKQFGVIIMVITIPMIIATLIETFGEMKDIYVNIFILYFILAVIGYIIYIIRSFKVKK